MKLLLCASSTRAMAESAKNAGYSFFSLDFFGDIDTRKAGENYSLREFGDSYSTENLYRRAAQFDFTHVIYGAGFENYPKFVEGFEKRAEVLGNDSKTLRNVRDPENFFSTLGEEKIPFPGTEIVRAGDIKDLNGRLLKSLKTGGGLRVYDSREMPLDNDDDVLFQEFIRGTPMSTCIVGDGERCRFLGATKQLTFRRYRYCGNIAPVKTTKDLEDISVRIGEIFHLKGVNGIDFISTPDDGPYVLEVNPRLTGAQEVLEKAYGVNLLDVSVRACGKDIDFRTENSGKYHYRKVVYAKEDRTLRPDKIPTFIKDVPADEHIPKDSPICTIIGDGETPDECIKDLSRKEKEI